MTLEEIIAKLPGMHQEQGTDLLLKHDLKWKIVGMNGRDFPTKDEGQVPGRVLLTFREEVIQTARAG